MGREFGAWYADQIGPGIRHFTWQLDKQLSDVKVAGRRVLEIGCGKGAVSLYLAIFKGIQEVYAVDEDCGHGASQEVLRALREGVEKLKVTGVKIIAEDFQKLDLPLAHFDLIVANYSLHHIVPDGGVGVNPQAKRNYLELLNRLRMLLSPGGTLSLREVNGLSLWRHSPVKLRQRQIDWKLHPEIRDWRIMFKEANLRVVSFQYLVPFRLRRFERLLQNRGFAYLWGMDFLVNATPV